MIRSAAVVLLIATIACAPARTVERRLSPTPVSVATATQTATATQCPEPPYQAGDRPIVPPRTSGQHLRVALDAVRPGESGHNRWMVRFYVPSSAPGNAEVPLRASASGPSGALQVFGYDVGPPNAESARITNPLVLTPCRAGTVAPGTEGWIAILGVETSAVATGSYTFAIEGLRLPEGTTTTERWTVTLTCTPAAAAPGAPATTECR